MTGEKAVIAWRQTIGKLARQIAVNEGYFIAGSRPYRNRNPGDLRNWPGFGADGDGFTDFGDDATGWDRLCLDLMNHVGCYPQQTILEFIAGDAAGWPGYAPARDGNDPVSYAASLARALGVSIYSKLGSLGPNG